MSAACVLCVDATGEGSRHLVGLLESEGFLVERTGDGRATLQRLQRRPRPALIVTILTGVVGDVLEVAGMVCRDPTLSDIPVVAVAHEGTAGIGDVGFAACLVPPVEAESLVVCLEELLDGTGPDPLGPVRRNLRALVQADGDLEVSLQEALDALDELASINDPAGAPQPGASEGHNA